MEKILFLEFYEGTSLKSIYEELIYYHQNRQLAETIYKGITLSNVDIDKLKDTITRLELGLTPEEYEEYKKYEQKSHNQFNLYITRQRTPYIVRYWIERVSDTITSSKKEEWEMCCYSLISSAYARDDIQKELLKAYYSAIISASKILLVLCKYQYRHEESEIIKVIEEEFSIIDDDFEMNNKYLFIDSVVSKFGFYPSIYKKFSYYDKIMDKDKYANLEENPITKKRIPDYLRINARR